MMVLSNDSFRELVEQASDTVFLLDADGVVIYANAAAEALFGRPAAELLGQSFGHVVTAEQPTEIQIPHPRRGTVTADIRSSRTDLSGETFDVVYLRDVTERRQAQESLKRINRALRVLSAGNTELIHAQEESALLDAICRLCVDLGGYRMAWVGYARHDEAKSVHPQAQDGFEDGYLERAGISWSEDNIHGRGPVGRALRTGAAQVSQNILSDPTMAPWRVEALRRGYKSGAALPLREASIPFGVLVLYASEPDAFNHEELRLLTELADDLAFGIVTLRAQAQHKLAEERIEHLAYFDPLTDLPNRNRLLAAMQQATDGLREGKQYALLTLNVARFGEMQAGIGVRQADELLRQIAERIQDALKENELPTRVNGDEFAVLLSGGGIDEIQDCVKRIDRALVAPFQQAGIPISVQMRIGAALAPEHGEDPEALLLRSGMAMRHAKMNGTKYELYSGPAESESPHHLALITELHTAVEENQFLLHYQPKVNLETGKVSGAEALVRWRHPVRGYRPPKEFIGIAEQTGLIEPLTYLVLEAALHQCHLWSVQGFNIPVAVNISVNSFYDPTFLGRVDEMLQTWKVRPELLQLEITESTLMKEPVKVWELLNQLKDRGVMMSIDDFGTGYSSLNYVANLPIHTLKIDRSFVIQMLESPRTRSVIEATISLAHSLGILAVAEGVDAKEQVEALYAMGCTEIQGFYFSKPIEADALRRWAAEFSLESYQFHPTTDSVPDEVNASHNI